MIDNNKKKILILDDEKISINILMNNLKENYNVYYTTKYKEALKILERIDIDLILLDIVMPEISGFEFLDIINNNSNLKKVQTLFITSKNDSEIIESFKQYNTPYVFKPFDTDEVKSKIDSVIADYEASLNQKKVDNNLETILIVDDNEIDIKVIKGALNREYNLLVASTPNMAIQKLEKYNIDLILLDIMMPEMNGYEFCTYLKDNKNFKDINVIFLTVKSQSECVVKGLEAGGVDFISKPFNRRELLLRINTHLEIKRLHDELKEKNRILENRKFHLEYLIKEKTEKIEKVTSAMVTALESANLYNDEDTGNHIKRVTFYAVLIAKALKMPSEFINKIESYASLHDIGKIGTPSEILRKKGKLSVEEFKEMKKHTLIGCQILSDNEIDDVARNIVRHHHEKWDGSGYPDGLKGEAIPLEARIVAIADVYDALTNARSYKEAFSHELASNIMKNERAKHFDPKLIDLFFENTDKILKIKKEFS